mmetsp:Transcript_15980/g.47417  ORF Transcript_15980/g.47417 Transcript_15980/m.47417 type:complete len:208 (+) Transcript_15980:140-763(+)
MELAAWAFQRYPMDAGPLLTGLWGQIACPAGGQNGCTLNVMSTLNVKLAACACSESKLTARACARSSWQLEHDRSPIAAAADAAAPYLPNWRSTSRAATTAFMNAARMPARSSSCSPAMVVPPGDVTMSLRAPGCLPVSITILAAPSTVCGGERRRDRQGVTETAAGGGAWVVESSVLEPARMRAHPNHHIGRAKHCLHGMRWPFPA